MAITIVGLGPGDPNQLTRKAWQVLVAADEVYLRTRYHPTVAALPQGLVLHSFDHLYEDATGFEEVYAAIAADIHFLVQDFVAARVADDEVLDGLYKSDRCGDSVGA